MSSRHRPASVRQVILVSLGSAVVLAGFYGLSRMGSSKYESSVQKTSLTREQIERLRVIAEAAEEKWDQLKIKRKEAGEPFVSDDLLLIGEAAVARMQYETQVEGVAPRYPDLRKELHDRSGEVLRAESLRLEKLGTADESLEKYSSAEKFFSAALAIEERINSEFPESASRNMQRTNFLTNRVRVMIARPLWARSQADEAAAEAAFSRNDFPAAIAAFDAALKANVTLEYDFRGLTRADSFRTRRLERRLVTIKSTVVRDRALANLEKAEKQVAERKFDGLNTLRLEVEAAARDLTENYSGSEYAAPGLVAGLVRRAQNAASAQEAEAIETELAAFARAVAAGDGVVTSKIEGLQRSVRRVREVYPSSDRVGAGVAERVSFLFEHRTELLIVGSAVKSLLLPVPGKPGILASKVETRQRLYGLVVGDNPSATRGDDFPVDSITRAEARSFCEKLGWILGATVRLPDDSEFLAISGEPDAAGLLKVARLVDNSDGRTAASPCAPANSAGFHDTFGNVAEWVESPSLSTLDEGVVAGGDAESSAAELVRTRFRRMPKSERSRFVGFRFVVEKPATPRP